MRGTKLLGLALGCFANYDIAFSQEKDCIHFESNGGTTMMINTCDEILIVRWNNNGGEYESKIGVLGQLELGPTYGALSIIDAYPENPFK